MKRKIIRVAVATAFVTFASQAIWAEAEAGISSGSVSKSMETLATDDTSEAEGHPVTSQKAAFGMYIGFGPAIVGMDLRIGRVYSFLSGSLLIPLLNLHCVDLAFGIGPTFRFFSDSWAFDVFAVVITEFSYTSRLRVYPSVGTGVGLRYVHPKGFSVSFKLPFFGLAVRDRDFLYYYFHFIKSVPVLSVGYTF